MGLASYSQYDHIAIINTVSSILKIRFARIVFRGHKAQMDQYLTNLSERMRAAARAKGYTIADIAAALEMKHSAVSHYFNGVNEPKTRTLLKFSEIVGVSIQDLLQPASETTEDAEEVDLAADEYVKLPVRDGTIEGGSGAGPAPNEIIGQMVFSKSWLDAHGMAPSECSLILIQDKHMSPTLIPGDVVLIDHRKTNPVGKEVFALRSDDGQLWVRRLEVEPDKLGLFVHCDNSKFRTLLIPPDKREANPIIGKVVWSSRRWP